ncbi:MAG: type II toxin-antitoxin system HicA family toxin [bacterium]|nr:type II toxin-antitoxin system HicA family toxin [bacterium]
MGAYEKLIVKVLRGTSDANIPFSEICQLLKKLDFDERVRGDHHIFTKYGIEEILNLQPKRSKAKPYQVKQVRDLILKYKLKLEEKDDE